MQSKESRQNRLRIPRATTSRSSLTFVRGGLVLLVPLLLVVLLLNAGCDEGPATNHGKPSNTPTMGVSSTTANTPAAGTTTATATPGPVAFQANFTEQYTVTTCSGNPPTGTVCVTTTGSGSGKSGSTALGSLQLTRTSIYAPGGSDSCGPATTTGTLTMGNGQTLTFRGTGTFCRATQTATFTYTITGGTGTYAQAKGTGNILVPLPNSSSTGTETWNGSLLA